MEIQQIEQWITDNLNRIPTKTLNPSEVEHVAMCLDHLTRHFVEDYPVGGFLSAVVANDFCEGIFRADDINLKALPLYPLFIWNCLPDGYARKIIRGREL